MWYVSFARWWTKTVVARCLVNSCVDATAAVLPSPHWFRFSFFISPLPAVVHSCAVKAREPWQRVCTAAQGPGESAGMSKSPGLSTAAVRNMDLDKMMFVSYHSWILKEDLQILVAFSLFSYGCRTSLVWLHKLVPLCLLLSWFLNISLPACFVPPLRIFLSFKLVEVT